MVYGPSGLIIYVVHDIEKPEEWGKLLQLEGNVTHAVEGARYLAVSIGSKVKLIDMWNVWQNAKT